MGCTASRIPKETLRVANIVATMSGTQKAIVDAYYTDKDLHLTYSGGIATFLLCGDRMKSSEILTIHVVKGNDDLLVETIPIVYVVSSSLRLQSRDPPNEGTVMTAIQSVMDDELDAQRPSRNCVPRGRSPSTENSSVDGRPLLRI